MKKVDCNHSTDRSNAIVAVLEALDEAITPCDSAGQFLIATQVVDTLVDRGMLVLRRKPKKRSDKPAG